MSSRAESLLEKMVANYSKSECDHLQEPIAVFFLVFLMANLSASRSMLEFYSQRSSSALEVGE